MFANAIIGALRQRIGCLEETQRRFSRTISIADVVDQWLPQGGLSAGCIHEVKGTSLANAITFSAVLSSRLAADRGNILYLAPDCSLHPLGLLPYGVKLEQILHVSVKRSQDLAWAAMEGLRCRQVSSVIALLEGLDLTHSRRLQLAAETSGSTAFFVSRAASISIASPITRWKVSSAIGKPGRRFDEPLWELELLYCRGGRPGKWILEWNSSGKNLKSIPAETVTQESYRTLAG